jgi:hypothetical protein
MTVLTKLHLQDLPVHIGVVSHQDFHRMVTND